MSRIRIENRNAEDLLVIKRAAQDEHYKRLRDSRESGFALMKRSASRFNERFRKAKISF